MVDYTSPALCAPVTPFPPTGDAAYRQHAGGGTSHGYRQQAQKFSKDPACGSGDILADRQTDRHTHHNSVLRVTNPVMAYLHAAIVAVIGRAIDRRDRSRDRSRRLIAATIASCKYRVKRATTVVVVIAIRCTRLRAS